MIITQPWSFVLLFVVCYIVCFHINNTYVLGILDPDGKINNKKSIIRLAQIAVAYAKAGKREILIYKGCYGTIILLLLQVVM